ncbi:MAG: bifunctional folylpolyglutamate synthase/dihydrofolate synthase [Phycisphaerales bacterium]
MASESATGKDGSGRRSKRSAFVNHAAAVEFLESRVNVERTRPSKIEPSVWKLDRMRAMLGELGNPHDQLQIVHIAGSKGKGSVCMMLESTLEACGYTTGVFTSPHLIDVRERVRVAGMPIGEDEFRFALERCRDASAAVEHEHGKATYFELLTALAFVVFADQAVDAVVLETGIGGELDCTNVVTPMICGLTSIHLEHTQVLGDTLGAIARQKAGIMKPGVMAISLDQHEEAMGVFESVADERGAVLRVLGKDIEYSSRFQSGVGGGPRCLVCVGDEGVGFEHIAVPLLGAHQAENCGLVLAILLELRDRGYAISERAVASGLEQMDRHGRLECICQRPRIYVDGAHTPESVRGTLSAIGAHLEYDSLILVFGCAGDKDVAGMFKEVERGADKVLFTKASGNPRAMDPQALCERFREHHRVMCESRACVKDAINAAAMAVTGNDLIVLIGSFYVAGEGKRLLEERRAKRSV